MSEEEYLELIEEIETYKPTEEEMVKMLKRTIKQTIPIELPEDVMEKIASTYYKMHCEKNEKEHTVECVVDNNTIILPESMTEDLNPEEVKVIASLFNNYRDQIVSKDVDVLKRYNTIILKYGGFVKRIELPTEKSLELNKYGKFGLDKILLKDEIEKFKNEVNAKLMTDKLKTEFKELLKPIIDDKQKETILKTMKLINDKLESYDRISRLKPYVEITKDGRVIVFDPETNKTIREFKISKDFVGMENLVILGLLNDIERAVSKIPYIRKREITKQLQQQFYSEMKEGKRTIEQLKTIKDSIEKLNDILMALNVKRIPLYIKIGRQQIVINDKIIKPREELVSKINEITKDVRTAKRYALEITVARQRDKLFSKIRDVIRQSYVEPIVIGKLDEMVKFIDKTIEQLKSGKQPKVKIKGKDVKEKIQNLKKLKSKTINSIKLIKDIEKGKRPITDMSSILSTYILDVKETVG